MTKTLEFSYLNSFPLKFPNYFLKDSAIYLIDSTLALISGVLAT